MQVALDGYHMPHSTDLQKDSTDLQKVTKTFTPSGERAIGQ